MKLSKLGSSPWQSLKITFFYIYFFLRDRWQFLPKLSIKIKFDLDGSMCAINVDDVSLFWALKDVFIDREYDIELTYEPKIIVDLGANIGISTLFFAAKYPQAKIHAFEPNPQTFEVLERNVAGMSNVVAHRYAVSDRNGKLNMSSPTHSMHSSIVSPDSDEHSVGVDAITPDNIFEKIGAGRIDILKFDIEGSEICLFQNFKKFSSIRTYVGEMHYDLVDLPVIASLDIAKDYDVSERYVDQRKKRSIILLQSRTSRA